MSATQSVFRRIVCHGFICWAGVRCISAHAESGIIFQIGVPDGDYREFAIAGYYADYAKQFPHDVDFVVGQSDAGRDWPYIQPGPDDDWAGHKPHTFTIHFQVQKQTHGYSGKGETATLILPKPVAELFRCDLEEGTAQKLKADGQTISVPVKAFSPVTQSLFRALNEPRSL